MSVELDICNSALIKVGATPISDLLEDTKEARLCNLQYPKIRDAALRSAPWSFAIRRKTMASVSNHGFDFIDKGEYVFALPQDCVKVWKLWGQPNVRFRVEGRYLIADDSVVNLYFVSKGIHVDSYDACFKETVACLLAADVCYSLTQSQALKQGLEGTADFWINQARSYNSQEGTPDRFEFDTFLDSRVGGRAIYE